MDDEKTITLRKPITVGEQTIYELCLKEPTGAQYLQTLRTVSGGATSFEGELLLISQVSGVELPLVKAIGVRDLKEARTYLAGFFDDFPKTGSGEPRP